MVQPQSKCGSDSITKLAELIAGAIIFFCSHLNIKSSRVLANLFKSPALYTAISSGVIKCACSSICDMFVRSKFFMSELSTKK